jgi:hypothetical protein
VPAFSCVSLFLGITLTEYANYFTDPAWNGLLLFLWISTMRLPFLGLYPDRAVLINILRGEFDIEMGYAHSLQPQRILFFGLPALLILVFGVIMYWITLTVSTSGLCGLPSLTVASEQCAVNLGPDDAEFPDNAMSDRTLGPCARRSFGGVSPRSHSWKQSQECSRLSAAGCIESGEPAETLHEEVGNELPEDYTGYYAYNGVDLPILTPPFSVEFIPSGPTGLFEFASTTDSSAPLQIRTAPYFGSAFNFSSPQLWLDTLALLGPCNLVDGRRSCSMPSLWEGPVPRRICIQTSADQPCASSLDAVVQQCPGRQYRYLLPSPSTTITNVGSAMLSSDRRLSSVNHFVKECHTCGNTGGTFRLSWAPGDESIGSPPIALGVQDEISAMEISHGGAPGDLCACTPPCECTPLSVRSVGWGTSQNLGFSSKSVWPPPPNAQLLSFFEVRGSAFVPPDSACAASWQVTPPSDDVLTPPPPAPHCSWTAFDAMALEADGGPVEAADFATRLAELAEVQNQSRRMELSATLNLRSVVCGPWNSGVGYIMYSRQSLVERFNSSGEHSLIQSVAVYPPDSGSWGRFWPGDAVQYTTLRHRNHFVCVKSSPPRAKLGSTWTFDALGREPGAPAALLRTFAFTPTPTDVLVAQVDFGMDLADAQYGLEPIPGSRLKRRGCLFQTNSRPANSEEWMRMCKEGVGIEEASDVAQDPIWTTSDFYGPIIMFLFAVFFICDDPFYWGCRCCQRTGPHGLWCV